MTNGSLSPKTESLAIMWSLIFSSLTTYQMPMASNSAPRRTPMNLLSSFAAALTAAPQQRMATKAKRFLRAVDGRPGEVAADEVDEALVEDGLGLDVGDDGAADGGRDRQLRRKEDEHGDVLEEHSAEAQLRISLFLMDFSRETTYLLPILLDTVDSA